MSAYISDGLLVKRRSAWGIASAWFGQRFDVDSVALAGFVGRDVPGLAVGSSVVPVYGRHPMTVAGLAQTVQAATGGRYTLGLGLGAKAFVEPVFGERHDRPVLRLREFLTALRSVLETGSVDVAGETLVARTPMPASVPGGSPLPVVVAAMGPQALRSPVSSRMARSRSWPDHGRSASTSFRGSPGRRRPRGVRHRGSWPRCPAW